MRRWVAHLGTPAKIGLAVGLLGAVLTVVGLFLGNLATLSVKSVALGILAGGGSWGLVSWAIASAARDASE